MAETVTDPVCGMRINPEDAAPPPATRSSSDPKTASGRRAVALDRHTVAILREHCRQQLERRDRRRAAKMAWIDSGYVFTRKNRQPINPTYATT